MFTKLFYGKYYIRQAKSYLHDVVTYATSSLISENILNVLDLKNFEKFENSKIIVMQIPSRNKRGLKKEGDSEVTEIETEEESKINTPIKKFRDRYKVFIQYVPGLNSPESIKGNNLISLLIFFIFIF